MKPDWRLFWQSWAAFFLLAVAWSIANPLMASPDEPAHTVRAASVVRGQLVPPATEGGSLVRLPYFYNLVTGYPICYMFVPEETGVCEPEATRPLDEIVDVVTPAGRYNPLYYAVVGLPTLLPPGDGVLYAMRAIAAALSTFFLALGMRSLAQTPHAGWALPGAAAALTPMVVFLTSTVNPAAIEITAAFALWCQLLTLVRHPEPSRTVSRMAWIALSTIVMVNARGLSLLYCGVLVVIAVLVSRGSAVIDVLRTRGTWPSFGAIALGGLAAAGWVLGTNSLGSGGEVRHPGLMFLSAAKISVLATGNYVRNMIGQFGWTDTELPTLVFLAFAAAAGLVLVLAVALGTWRDRLAIAAVAALSVIIPVLVHSSQAKYLGIIWQGRYILPVAIGIPLVAGYVVARRIESLPSSVQAAVERPGAAITTVVAVALSAVQLVAFTLNLHRYVNGIDGGWFSLAPDAWLPPVPLVVVVLLGVGGAAAFGGAFVHAAWSLRGEDLPRTGAPNPSTAA